MQTSSTVTKRKATSDPATDTSTSSDSSHSHVSRDTMKVWRREYICAAFIVTIALIILIQVFYLVPNASISEPAQHKKDAGIPEPAHHKKAAQSSQIPVIVDWTDHHGIEETQVRSCTANNQKFKCIYTNERSAADSDAPQAIVFYGTDTKMDDFPLPRKPNHVWVLSHEESPKNNIIFSFKGIMDLFNYTSTFRRESNLPLTTQYLRSVEQLESTKYMKSYKEKISFAETEDLAPVIYVQSDCGTPSDRDNLVKMLSKHIKIDSYGTCEHNKDLPKHLVDPVEGMTHKDFLELVSKYKFAISMENGICNDYITEKFWRPLHVGTVPIVLGSPSISDFTPDKQSILAVNDYRSIKELASHMEKIASSEEEYESYRQFKKKGGVTNQLLKKTLEQREWEPDQDVELNINRVKPNFPELFQCKVCEMMHNVTKGMKYQATVDHYGCPFPVEYADENDLTKTRPFSDMWASVWKQTGQEVDAFLSVSNGGREKADKAEVKRLFHKALMNNIG